MLLPFYITCDGKTHQKEKEEISVEDLYQFMVDHKDIFPMTSMPSVEDYLEVFEPILKHGEDIICICITTKFSGSYNSAYTAKQILAEDYLNNK